MIKHRVRLLVIVAAVSLVVSTSLFWIFEREVNGDKVHNLFDVVYWFVVTSATVGYGDIVPLTWQGRVVTIFTILTGFFIYASFVAIIAETAHEYIERKIRGTAQVKAKHHIVLCEYTAIADELIHSLPDLPGLCDREVVIVSDLVSRNPYPKHSFVCGVPISPTSLLRANVQEADYVFIFANLRFADPDVKTLHTAHRVLKLNTKATVFVELVDPNHDLLAHASRRLIPMDSRYLIECVLRESRLDPTVFLKKAEESECSGHKETST